MTPEVIEALSAMGAVGARAFFCALSKTVCRMDSVRYQLEEDFDYLPQGGSGIRGGGIPKPTEARALWLVCDAPELYEKLTEELSQLELEVGYGLVLCQYVRDGLGRKYGDALETKYIDCLSWSQVAAAMCTTTGYAKRLGGIAIDWLDMKSDVGEER